MIKWNDVTSYSRNDKERIPQTFTVCIGQIEIGITHYVGCGDEWFFYSRDLGISPLDHRSLNTTDPEVAKVLALEAAHHLIEATCAKFITALAILKEFDDFNSLKEFANEEEE